MPITFIGTLKAVSLKPYLEKDAVRARSCCSHSIRVEGTDEQMEEQYRHLKGLFGARVKVVIEPEQSTLSVTLEHR